MLTWNRKGMIISLIRSGGSNGKVNETYKTLKEALGRTCNSSKPKINTLIMNKKETSCPQEITTGLNSHFTDIEEKVLAENTTEM